MIIQNNRCATTFIFKQSGQPRVYGLVGFQDILTCLIERVSSLLDFTEITFPSRSQQPSESAGGSSAAFEMQLRSQSRGLVRAVWGSTLGEQQSAQTPRCLPPLFDNRTHSTGAS